MKREHGITDQQIQANNALIKTVNAASDNDFSYETDWQKIKECLETEKPDPNCAIDRFGTTILILACSHEKKDFVDYLLQREDVKVNLSNKRGWTPLFLMLQTLKPNNEEEPEEKEPAIEIIKSLLEHKADLESKVWGEIPLPFVAQWGYKDLIKPLIVRGADINQADVWGHNPLNWAIKNKDLAMITELCQAGASLFNVDELGYNAFHVTANLPKEYIQVLITHTQFNSEIINKERDEQIKKEILEMLWAFKQVGFPQEIQFNILSKLSPSYFYNADKGLCKKLFEMGYVHPSALAQLNNRIEWVKQALQDSNNKSEKNPLDYLLHKNKNKKKYKPKPEVEVLLSVNELQSAYDLFDKNFPYILDTAPNNLICQMYMNQ